MYRSLFERLLTDLAAAGFRRTGIVDSEDEIERQCSTPEAIAIREQIVAAKRGKMDALMSRPQAPALMSEVPLDPVPYNLSYLEQES